MTQLLLFGRQGPQAKHAPDICAARHRGAPTSIEAHERIRPHKSHLRNEILLFLTRRGLDGATVQEISLTLKIPYTTTSARCAELKVDGLIYVTSRRRRTTSGATARVLRSSEVLIRG